MHQKATLDTHYLIKSFQVEDYLNVYQIIYMQSLA